MLSIFFCISVCIFAIAQTLPDPGTIIDGVKGAESWTELLGYQAVIYTLLFNVGGWLSAFIPGLKRIEDGTYRVLVWAILVIAGGLVIGWGNIWIGAISYFFSTSLYDVILKWIIKSPKPAELR